MQNGISSVNTHWREDCYLYSDSLVLWYYYWKNKQTMIMRYINIYKNHVGQHPFFSLKIIMEKIVFSCLYDLLEEEKPWGDIHFCISTSNRNVKKKKDWEDIPINFCSIKMLIGYVILFLLFLTRRETKRGLWTSFIYYLVSISSYLDWFGLVSLFNGISTSIGYSMPKSFF